MYNSMHLPNAKIISIPVVQELAAMDPQALPERFIREEEERPPLIATDSLHSNSIPIIDMELLSENHECRPKMMENLASACQEWGLFQVVNHGIPGSVLERMKGAVRGFFQLPLEEKLKYGIQDSDGYGQSFVFSDEQKLDWSDMFGLSTLPENIRNMAFWPTKPMDFRGSTNEFAIETNNLSDTLLSLIAESLGIKANSFIYPEGKWMQGIRMNYYPRCPRPDLVLGISPHSDPYDITILLQDDETVGLHIHKNEEWVPVLPIPGALVIFIGDMLEVRSNGRYKSIEHLAVPNKSLDRLSIVVIRYSTEDVEIGPYPDLIDDTHPALYTTFKRGDYDKKYMEKKLEAGKPTLQFYKIESLT